MPVIFALTALALVAGLTVIGATLVYVAGVFVCGLSLAARKYEPEIRTVLSAGDICKKCAKKAIKKGA